MSWEAIFWQIPLGARPHISQTAVAVHGRVPVETYLLPRHWCVHIYRYDAQVKINGRAFRSNRAMPV